ncbi:MAG: Tat pathway signal sequence domain protein [Gammaproteobacteria bacterium]
MPTNRRTFLKTGAGAAVASLPLFDAAAQPSSAQPSSTVTSPGEPAELHWLDGAALAQNNGSTFTVPWPRGQLKRNQPVAVSGVPSQTWPLAYWPDGSLKWTAHALPAGATLPERIEVKPGREQAAARPLSIREAPDTITIDTGVIACVLPRRGEHLIASITRDGRVIATDAHLVALSDDQPDASAGVTRQSAFVSAIASAAIEQRGPVRAVVKIDGHHRGAGRDWLPFSVRLYFYAGAESVRIMHTFVFDGDEHKDYLRGIGLRFGVPMRDALHDRHVRFAGEAGGVWGEGVRNLTGLRRDPGAAVRAAQVAGQACPPLDQFAAPVRRALPLIPAWGDYTLTQASADSFQVRKRTQAGHGWIDAAWGRRAPGVGYLGGASGGVAFGLRDFWQRHPTQLDIRDAHLDTASVTLWMHAPDARAMDLRFYHDGMGMDTHAEELEGLEITYEDYEQGYGTPVGVARSSEITLWALGATPARERMAQFAQAVQHPPQLVASPRRYLATGVFGQLWNLPDRGTPAKAAIEDQLEQRLAYYQGQIEQRHWYGFWDYGDIRHTYDADRHEWRYDVGGFAWDNSELSPDLWLWYSFLRSGRADIFRMAEAMVRHTSEVDTYHLGRFAGLGSRHNVQHWGCSAKQVRISTAVYRRHYYFLTADERIGDIMRELLDADRKLDAVDPVRKIAKAPPKGPWPARIAFGTDWSSMAANWLAEWERGGDTRYRDKLLRGMRDLAAMPHGFFSAERAGYEPDTGRLHNMVGDEVHASHLNAVFGAGEIFDELIALTGDKAFERAWLQYCELFNATVAEQIKALGAPHKAGNALYVGHSRLTAYAAWKRNDAALARRAWQEFASRRPPAPPVRVSGPAVLNPVDEMPDVSTSETAQWGLAAIQNLALIGQYL